MPKGKRRRPFGSTYRRKDSATWVVEFRWKRRTYRRSGGRTRAEAQKRLATVAALLRSGVKPSRALAVVFDLGVTVEDGPTLAALETPYVAYIEKRLRPSTVAADKRRLSRLIRTLPFARASLASVQRKDVATFMEARLRKGAAPSTVNRDLSLLSALFRYAVEKDLVDRNPVRDVRRPSEQGRAREGYLTPEDAKHLLGKVDEAIRPLVVVLLSTGARLRL